jgi:transposase-like protein
MSTLSQKHLHDEVEAYRFVEAKLWPNGPVCPRCKETKRVGKLNGKSTRIGVYKCYACRKPFNVKVGTLFEASHIPLHKWLQAILLLCASKKGFSTRQLARTLDLQPRHAWFLGHRIREGMRSGALSPPMMGAGANFVEVDETYIGTKKGVRKRRGPAHKMAVLTLVERGRDARSFHVGNTSYTDLFPILAQNIDREARIATDEAGQYIGLRRDFPAHESVNHKADEWRRGDVHTNTVEAYFSVFKRGMKGVYQHCSEKHLHRYLAEFDFRYNARSALGVEDLDRAERALRGVRGRRLTYKKSLQARMPTS